MERRLIVMRHAQARQPEPGQTDHQRPLSDLGHRQASEIAQRLSELGWTPDLVVSSDAERTRQTWEAMKPNFDPSPEAIWRDDLYLAGVDAAMGVLTALDDHIGSVLILGHNPGWQAVISYLAGRRERLTPANAALLQTAADTWAETAGSQGFQLTKVLRPRSL